MNISFGIITKDFVTTEPIDEFLENAKLYGHDIYSVVIGYSHRCDKEVVKKLSKKVSVFTVKINESKNLKKNLRELDISEKSISTLLHTSTFDKYKLVPYSHYRNNVVMKSIFTGSDVLIFVDTDVYPKVLVQKDNAIGMKEVDFIGRHMEYLNRDDVVITTSDYSGYYIIPPMNFAGMKKLFMGLGKESSYEYLMKHSEHNCLALDNDDNRKVFETNKILGGNVAIKLSGFRKLLPFFSSVYEINGTGYLTRGEDTLLGLNVEDINKKCIDIDTRIFHNTYSNYPAIPDIKNNKSIRDRFFYACMGWIGRNPFLAWIKGDDIQEIREHQLKNIKIGSRHIAKYLDDERFLILPKALEASYDHLDKTIKEFESTILAWKEFIIKLEEGSVMNIEDTSDQSLSTGGLWQWNLH